MDTTMYHDTARSAAPEPRQLRDHRGIEIPRDSPSLVITLCVTLVATLALFDASHVGFFADDFLFLDAARRFPVSEVLLGHHGIYPWYRPLSRELYFYAALLCGPAGRPITFGLSLLTAVAGCYMLLEIGRRMGAAKVGITAAGLFATHSLTKLLVAWGSGYQDLLSATLTLAAVTLELRGSTRWSFACAVLSAFAKETGLIAVLLIGVAHVLRTSRRPTGRYISGTLVTLGLIIALHVIVRLTWTTGGSTRVIEHDAVGLVRALAGMLNGFVAPMTVWSGAAAAAAGLATVFTWLALRGKPTCVSPGRSSLLVLAIVGWGLGLAPLVVGNALRVSVAHTYYTFPSLAWGCILLAAVLERIPQGSFRLVVPVLLAWNIYGLGYRAPNLDKMEGWHTEDPSWREAVRISAATERFASDLKAFRQMIPRGGTVVYSRLPVGSFFVLGDDGAATRIMLDDPSVHAYFITSTPPTTSADSVLLVRFDIRTKHLRPERRDDPELLVAAASRVVMGDLTVARLIADYVRPGDPRLAALKNYLRGIVGLGARGSGDGMPGRNWPLLRSGRDVTQFAEALAPTEDVDLVRAYEEVLAAPTAAQSHRALAESLLVRGSPLPAGVELRASILLDGGTAADHIVLGGILEEIGIPERALLAYRTAERMPAPIGVLEDAKLLSDRLQQQLLSEQHSIERW